MGALSAQIQSPQSSSSGKSGMVSDMADQNGSSQINPVPDNSQGNQPSIGKNGGMQGSQGAVTFPGQGGQPEMGMPNAYSNTIGPTAQQGIGGQQGSWDNSTQPNGKGSAGNSGSSSKGKR